MEQPATQTQHTETLGPVQGAPNPPIVLVDGYNVLLQWVVRVQEGLGICYKASVFGGSYQLSTSQTP